MLYQSGKIGDAELFEAVYETLSALPDAVAEERLPVDTVIVDTPKALQLTWIEALQRKLKALMYFVADRRLLTRIADVKTQIYGRYMRYASLIVANMLEKGDEKAPGIRMVNAFLTRVKMPSDYSAERIHRAVLGDRRNKELVAPILVRPLDLGRLVQPARRVQQRKENQHEDNQPPHEAQLGIHGPQHEPQDVVGPQRRHGHG
jgi:hypothetical protein